LDEQRWKPTDKFHVDTAHTDLNYFSVDFGGSTTWTGGDIPILAAAAGKVVLVRNNADNGNYIVIDHDGDGNLGTGYSTRYLHLKDGVLVSEFTSVVQGQILGYMGNTGASENIHLHFGVRYANQGYSTIPALQIVKIEGLHMKQYQTEVTSETKGIEVPYDGNYNVRVRSLNSYFPSTNTVR
jgi:murein DD-endopeptidase MepM/ murein hydrolase activator NlpD